jgi:hypothetical protein
VECAPLVLVADPVRRLPEKMITISGTNWFRPWRHLSTTRDIYEPIFHLLGVAVGIVKHAAAFSYGRPTLNSVHQRGIDGIQCPLDPSLLPN